MRSELQKECDQIDLELCRIELWLQNLADRIKVAGPALRGASHKVGSVRAEVRRFMHADDRKATPY